MNSTAKGIFLVFVVFLAHNLQTCMSRDVADWPDPPPCYNPDGEIIGLCMPSEMACTLQHGRPVNISCGFLYYFFQCCVFSRYECNVEVLEDEAYISSPNYPIPMDKFGSCVVRLENWYPFNSRQIRLDFIDFDMAKPSNEQTTLCDTDMLVVSSGDDRSSDMKVCGPYTHQHLYYSTDDLSNVINMKFVTRSSDSKQLWKVKVTRVDTEMEAPADCNQFYEDVSGMIQLVNFRLNGVFLRNGSFKTCIKREMNVCSIKYESCGLNDKTFEILHPLKDREIMPFIELEKDVLADILGYDQSGCVQYEQLYCTE